MGSSDGAAVEGALEAIGSGGIVVVVDHAGGGSAGSLVMAAQFATPSAVQSMAFEADGDLSLALAPERWGQLGLGRERSFDARGDAMVGIDPETHAIRVAVDPTKGSGDIVRPGRMRSLRSRPGGVLEHPGVAEAAVDLARLAGCAPAAVVSTIASRRRAAMRRVAAPHAVAIADLVTYRRFREPSVERVVATEMPTRFGRFTAVGYRSLVDGRHHLALVKGQVAGMTDVLVSVHPECLTGDVFHSHRCRCGDDTADAVTAIEAAGCGVLLYVSSQWPGERLRHMQPSDAVGASSIGLRPLSLGAAMLGDLGVSSIRLLTSEPADADMLQRFGLRASALDIDFAQCQASAC